MSQSNQKCPSCNGTGKKWIDDAIDHAGAMAEVMGNVPKCPTCNGTGVQPNQPKAEAMRLSVAVEDGKYTVVQNEYGELHAFRHGLPWRDCTGDKLIYALASELSDARRAPIDPATVDVGKLVEALELACKTACDLLTTGDFSNWDIQPGDGSARADAENSVAQMEAAARAALAKGTVRT